MPIFAFYFTTALLREAGWPRKLGRFKGEGYDTEIADAALAQSIDWGATLGAGRPRLTLQMIAEMFRERDWDGDEAPDVRAFVETDTKGGTWATGASPQDAVRPLELATNWGKSISVENFFDQRMRALMEQPLVAALLWGLSFPDRFEAWYRRHVEDYRASAAEARSFGLDVGSELPSLSENYENAELIIRDYERDLGPLPPIPPKLLADAEALGWRV